MSGAKLITPLKLILNVFLLLWLIIPAGAQSDDYLIHCRNGCPVDVPATVQFRGDSLEFLNEIGNVLKTFHEQGFLLADIESVFSENGKDVILINPGSVYQWAVLDPGNAPESILAAINWESSEWRSRPVRPRKVSKVMQDIVDEAGNNGYPFASVKLDSVRFHDTDLFARMDFTPGPLIAFGELQTDESIVSGKFLETYLQLKQGDPYHEKRVKDIAPLLAKLPFVALNDPVALSFQNEEATINIPLRKVRSSTIDGFLGVLPNAGADNKLLVNGRFDLDLQNLFRSGKQIELHWQRIREQTQRLSIEYSHPLLFYSPLDVRASFQLLKEDTTFISRKFQSDFRYRVLTNGYMELGVTYYATRLLSTDRFTNTMVLPEISDLNRTSYQLNLGLDTRDNLLTPRNGGYANISVSVGNKKVLRNVAFEPVAYEGVDLNTVQWETGFDGAVYRRIGKTAILNIQLDGRMITSETLFLNEAYRLGGLKSLRGFTENFFFATTYLVGKIETHWYLDALSSFFVFYDQGYFENKASAVTEKDNPFGFGAGIRLGTKAGILNLVYALGKSKDQPLDFNFSKIHFGYEAKF